MANRLTKGKALVGSLDVQGELTINGTPVGAGGSGTPLVYTGYVDPQGMISQYWSVGMNAFQINNYQHYNQFGESNWITNNNIQEGDAFDVKVEYWNGGNSAFQPHHQVYGLQQGLFAGIAVYDMMANGTIIRVFNHGGYVDSMTSIIPRLTLRKKA